MVRVYAEGWKNVRSRLDQLQAEYDRTIALGEKPSLGWIYQNSRLADMQELIGNELSKFSNYAVGRITEEQRRVIEMSLEFSRDEMILRLGPEYDVSDIRRIRSLPIDEVIVMVGSNQQGSPLKALFDSINIEGSQKASDALVEGMMLGYNPRKIAPMIRDALGVQLNRALTISRTETMRAQRVAASESYKANADVMKGWRWQAALTGNTCPVCISMHGSIHPVEEEMESHINCRCCSVPVTKSWEELGAELGFDFSGVEKAGPSFEEIAKKYKLSDEQKRMYAQRKMTGEAYFRGLSAEEQRKILGPAKWLAWKEGKFEFTQLAKKTYSPVWGAGRGAMSLKELLGEQDAHYYLRLAQNGLAKQNLNADELIKFASLDLRPLTNREIGKITNFVAERGFNDSLLEKAGGRLSGRKWQGNTIKGSDMLGAGVVHYLRHVVFGNEWPAGTTLEDYYESIRDVVGDSQTKMFISRYLGELQAGFVRDAGPYKGASSKGIFFVEYRISTGSVVTANQAKTIDGIIESLERSGIIWIRK